MRSVEELIDIYECGSQVFAVKARPRARCENDVVGMEEIRFARIACDAYGIGRQKRRAPKTNVNAGSIKGCLKLTN